MDIKQYVAELLQPAIDSDIALSTIKNTLEEPKHDDHGDLAFPCFILAAKLRQAPAQIAQDLAAKLKDPLIEEVEVVGPYINFFFNRGKMSSEVLKYILTAKTNYGKQDLGQGRQVPIDMSSPNIAKPMSMGHLRSTVIGNAIGNILEVVGFEPVRINHLGDWGTQFGKLIVAYRLWGTEDKIKAEPIQELLRLYVKFHQEAEHDPKLEDAGREAFKALEDGAPEEMRLWKWFREESLQEFNKTYKKLGIEFDSYAGESFYNDKMEAIVQELKDKNLLKRDQGAEIVDLSQYDLNPALIKKSDGATLYMTRDLAAAEYRKKTYDFYESLYVVGSEQANHFKQLKAVLKEMGHEWSEDIHHIAFGLVTKDGEKLSTRKGKVVLLEEVLNEAISLSKKQIEEKNPELENKEKVAHAVGTGAVIFFDLRNDRRNSYDFNLQEITHFEGETGPYVQYANVRCHSILSKAEQNGQQAEVSAMSAEMSDEAFAIVKTLHNYPDTILRAYREFEPSVISKYLLALAQSFNRYYAHTRILSDDQGLHHRLALVKAVSLVLTSGLKILGIQAPEKM